MVKSKKTKIFLTLLLITLIVLSPILLIILGIFIWFIGSMGYGLLGYIFIPNPPKPEITYGEFPFEIVYEIDGEIFTIQDVYVCEYDGVSLDSDGSGKHRNWNGYIKSTGESKPVLLKDENITLACYIRSPGYYMNDPYETDDVLVSPYIFYIISPNDYGGTSTGVMDIDSFLDKYKLKLVSWKLSTPIKNSFK